MDITQLRTLIHVSELGSVSKAADRLGIAQPALSRQIRLLEQELKAPLFVRHGRGMSLTELGRQVLEPARRVLDELDAIRGLAVRETVSLGGRVRFGMPPTVADIMTVPLARAVRAAHPRIGLCLSSAFSGHLLDWLKRGDLDCAVSYDPQELGKSVRIRPVIRERLMLVSGALRGLQQDRPVPFAQLAGETLILPSPQHGLRAIAERCARRAGIALQPAIEADSYGAMVDLVREGFGATILPLAPVYARVLSGELTAAPLTAPEPTRDLVIAYGADRPVSAATRFAGDTFAAIAADLVARGIWAGEALGADGTPIAPGGPAHAIESGHS